MTLLVSPSRTCSRWRMVLSKSAVLSLVPRPVVSVATCALTLVDNDPTASLLVRMAVLRALSMLVDSVCCRLVSCDPTDVDSATVAADAAADTSDLAVAMSPLSVPKFWLSV